VPSRKLAVSTVAACAALALALAGVAAAANGGFTPVNAHSPNAARINSQYYVILGITAGIFVIVESLLVFFVIRYRNRGRPRDAEGPQVHGHTRLELIWTAIPVVILAVIASFVFYKLPGISGVPKASAQGGRLNITIDAHQFYWQFTYPNGAISIDEMHVPVGRVVYLTIRSEDVAHSWWIPELGGKIDAIPGRTNHTWFQADEARSYRGQCAEFCGLFHAAMTAHVIATSQQDYEAWLAGADARLGQSEFTGVCEKCHGIGGKGDYGPNLSQNTLLLQPAGVEDIVRHGRNRMPAVGNNWSQKQMNALTTYLRKHVYKGPQSGG
jgi:cytochrome c oxidase subunit II